MSDPKTPEQLREQLRGQPYPESVHSQVGQGDGRSTAELLADLAAGSDAWRQDVETGNGGWAIDQVAAAARGGR